jgi:hypothetical protein
MTASTSLLGSGWAMRAILVTIGFLAVGCYGTSPYTTKDAARPAKRSASETPSATSGQEEATATTDASPAEVDDASPAADDALRSADGAASVAQDEPSDTGDEPPPQDDLLGQALADAGSGDQPDPPKFVEQSPTLGEDALLVPTEDLQRLSPEFNVWTDKVNKRVVLAGTICRREGPLELFACLKQTKEHEAIVTVHTMAQHVHGGLVVLGIDPGRPVQFQPEYRPAEGPEIEVRVLWKDAEGKVQEARAQDWVRSVKTGEALSHPWVFGGSYFWRNEATGTEHYSAESGDLICVSNFASAMLDLPIESTQQGADLLFEAFTERIPPEETVVTLTLAAKEQAAAE